MTHERRIENIVGISDTLWQLNNQRVIGQIEALCGHPVPADCIELIECSFRFGAVLMEKAIGSRREQA